MDRNNIRIKFGKKLKQLRKVANLSQEDLGKKATIHRTYIGSIERGEQNISIDNIAKLAKALKATPKDLFDF